MKYSLHQDHLLLLSLMEIGDTIEIQFRGNTLKVETLNCTGCFKCDLDFCAIMDDNGRFYRDLDDSVMCACNVTKNRKMFIIS